ncbi:MAG: GNAT family N-acetyltransferase [Planctomycetes bacterium]|nr:GNAT family N-acetyltransferase [Planctomycetota bacterium]
MDQIAFRTEPVEQDKVQIRALLGSSGFFHPWEIEVAIELIEDRLAKGTASEYLLLFAESAGKIAGYACYGPVTMAQGRFELYWIAVDTAQRGRGIGKLLLGRAESHMRQLGGKYVYSETSSREIYRSTREFYRKQAFREVARVPFFYADDDDKVIFMKTL